MTRKDLVIAAALAVAAAGVTHRLADWRPSQVRGAAHDVWFDADSARVHDVETDRFTGDNDRITLHPAYPFVTYPAVKALRMTGLDAWDAVRAFHSAVAGVWMAGFFLLLRRFGLRIPDALVFTAVAATSAAAVFWLPVTESFVIGSLSMFPALWLVSGRERGSALAHAAAGVAAFGVTVTNWMAAFFASFMDLPRRRFVAVSAASLAATAAIGFLHLKIFPGSPLEFGDTAGDVAWMFAPEGGGPAAVARAFFFHGMVAPEIRFVANWKHIAWPLMTFQFSGLFTATAWSWPATAAWAGLLGLGAVALRRSAGPARLRATLALLLLYQLLLHLLYGRETFLYAMHFVPLLVMAAALATLTRWRTLALTLAVLLAVANAANNRTQLYWARGYSQRAPVLKRVQPMIDGKYSYTVPAVDPAWTYRFWQKDAR